MSVGESFTFLLKSRYIRDLATLVIIVHCKLVSTALILGYCLRNQYQFGGSYMEEQIESAIPQSK